jgi:transposase
MLYSGIDLHKRTLSIHTLDAAGTPVRKADLPTRRETVTAYVATIDGPHQAVCESTSMWYWARDLLMPQGIDLRLAHAKHLKAISYAKVKTDAVDAATMAQLLRVQLIPEAYMIREGTREVRDLLRARLLLESRRLQCQRAIGAMLEKYNVMSPAALPELAQLHAGLQHVQYALLKTQIQRLDHELRDRVLATPEAQRLVWVPGIGKMVAYTLLLEIDDIARFPTVRHFHSYCGLVPGSHDSGGKTRHKRSRDGNRYLKIAFHHAAIRAIQYFPEVKAEFQRWQRRKGKPIARALIAKELATIVYAVLSKGEPFNKQFHGHPVVTTKRCTWPRLANPPA